MNATFALPEHRETPTGRPQWYGQSMAREERPFLSWTGDVELFAGNTFPTKFTKVTAALAHAKEMSEAEQGAIFVLRHRDGHHPHGAAEGVEGKHKHSYWLSRAYNAEKSPFGDTVVGQTQLDGTERGFSNWDHHVVALVDGGVMLSPSGKPLT